MLVHPFLRFAQAAAAALSLVLAAAAAPSPNGYVIAPAFGGLPFLAPTQIVFAPGETTRAFVVEQAGRIAMIPDLTNPTRQVVVDLSASLTPDDSGHGMLSMAFHPQFAQNGYFYVWTSIWDGGARYLRLFRYTLAAGGTVDPASQLTIIDQPVGSGGHDGGTLLFGADGYLYLSIGDGDEGAAGAEAIASHQRIDVGYFGGVFRIDVDMKAGNLVPNAHLGVVPTNYLVPADNPFVGATSFNGMPVNPAQVRTEFWAAGLRNPFRMSFDSATGELWVGDVGLNLEEEIDVVTKGSNYGWNFLEGTFPGPAAASAPAGFTSAPPVWEYNHLSGDVCVTGGMVYHGALYPELDGGYIFADYESGRVWAATSPATQPFAAPQVTQIAAAIGITSITVQPGTGDILFTDLNHGLIERISGAAASAAVGPPVAATQPQSGTVYAGGTVALSFTITGSPATSYQWLLNGAPITGANSPLLLLKNVTDSAAGTYACLVTTATGSISSGGATLAVAAAGSASQLINLSTRATAGSGSATLTAGFVVGGPVSKTVLVRASGPALAAFSVTGLLPDPVLRIFAGAQQIAGNQGWGGDPQIAAVAASVGAFSWGSTATPDSALVVTLPPGAYTAQVSGAAGDSGVALVEVYEVQ